MSWFTYSDQPRRRYRKGIWLRIRSLPDDLLKEIKSRMKGQESLAWVTVQELRPKNQVLLEVWCYETPFPNERFTVFHVLTDENPNWICEGDMGRGLV
jgi:hypothetical protein